MKALYDIKEKLHRELEEYAHKPDLSAGDLEAIHKLTDTIKNIDKICMYEEGEYSGDGGRWDAHGSYDNGRSYGMGGHSNGRGYDGRSYNNGGMRGSYSGRNRHYVRGHYSYDEAKDKMYHELGEAAELATTQRQREILNKAMKDLENA